MSDFIKPIKFDMIIQAVQTVARQNTAENELRCPSVAIKAGHDKAWLARIKRGKAIRSQDGKAEVEANKFLKLHTSEWGIKVSHTARVVLNTRHSNKPVTLPKTSDL